MAWAIGRAVIQARNVDRASRDRLDEQPIPIRSIGGSIALGFEFEVTARVGLIKRDNADNFDH